MTDLIIPTRVSDYLLIENQERGENLTNLKLQKLLYYAQAWHLALKGQPLFDEDFQAWVHGPVLPSQYYRFREFQWRPIMLEIARPDVAPGVATFLNEIVDVFGSETAVALELMTHRETPWIEARGTLSPHEPSNSPISKESMQKYYRTLGAH